MTHLTKSSATSPAGAGPDAEADDDSDVRAVNLLAARGATALAAFSDLGQDAVDHIVAKASVAALDHHTELARHAVEETGRGIVEDKAAKNMFASEHVVHSLAHLKTVGVVARDDIDAVVQIAEPVGVVCAVTPVTNPTSTTIFKALLALKTRNPVVFAFHPAAQRCSAEAARIVRDAAVAAGAPEHCIQWIERPSLRATGLLMRHPGIALILATGGNAMVKAAYSAGKPAVGVGAGNVPAYVHRSADLRRAVNDIVLSKSFDNGMICASEQAVILDTDIYDKAMAAFADLHTHLATAEEKRQLESYLFLPAPAGHEQRVNPDAVGRSPQWIARQAGFSVPANTSVILVETGHVGPDEPLTREKLCPVLAVLRAETTQQGFERAADMIAFHGQGHSSVIHTGDPAMAEEYGQRMQAVRIIVNAPSSQGAIGGIYNGLLPSLTLGCGSWGGTSVSANVSTAQLLNIKRVTTRQNNLQWFKVPPKIYFEPQSIRYLGSMPDVHRVTVVTDATMTRLGYVHRISQVLQRRDQPVTIQVIDDVEPEPSIDSVQQGAATMRAFRPDTIIALGGGSPMDAAKVMWLLYEHPDIDFADIRQKFTDIRKRAFRFPAPGRLARLVCIPTTSGTGAEVTPFAVISDPASGKKYPLADYALTPSVAIIDPLLTTALPAAIAADSGFDTLTHATEAYVSVYANDFTDGLALQAIKLVFEHLEAAVDDRAGSPLAREKLHNAATIAGMAFGNAFLGIVHAMSHTLGATFHITHGRTNAVLLPHVIRYNGTVPAKLTSWPKYETYRAPERFQDIARMLDLPASTPAEAVASYAAAVERLRDAVRIEASFAVMGVKESDFVAALPQQALNAFDDQCAPANPRMPMLDDMRELMLAAYYGSASPPEEHAVVQGTTRKVPQPHGEQ
ncbi:bifunctional acetaldehyde-CoA/alcohol dehydrogenase [Streptomyces sp. NPDC049040]|uniref:bifunctional acetaldehyde-CoA/alcohol dehydrogenase n=1 Tax=Streptomyces sp. NPDC049040 TaxID=3365593 RepID=UPI00371AA204